MSYKKLILCLAIPIISSLILIYPRPDHAITVTMASVGTIAGPDSLPYPDNMDPRYVVADADGNVYVSDAENLVVWKVTPEGERTVFYDTLGVTPKGMAIDLDGNIILAMSDAGSGASHVYRITPDGTGTIIAGLGPRGYTGDGGPAVNAKLDLPKWVAVGSDGSIYVSDPPRDVIRKIDPSGIITTFVSSAILNSPEGLAFKRDGFLLVADRLNDRIIIVTPLGLTNIFKAGIDDPYGITFGSDGDLYVAQSMRNKIIKINPAGAISDAVGTGENAWNGDGLDPLDTNLYYPYGIAFGPEGRLYVTDNGHDRVRKVNFSRIVGDVFHVYTGEAGAVAEEDDLMISTIAGTGFAGAAGDDSPAINAELSSPKSVVTDSAGNIYISDYLNLSIRKIFAGTGVISNYFSFVDAGFNGIDIDSSGNLYAAVANKIIKIPPDDPTLYEHIAGTDDHGYRPADESAPAASALLNRPNGVAVDAAGNIYVADTNNHRVRKIIAGSPIMIKTYAGTGEAGFSGDNLLATSAKLRSPYGVAVDAGGNVYITDSWNHRIRVVDAVTKKIKTIAGTGSQGYSGDGGLALSAKLNYPTGIRVTDDGSAILFADYYNNRIRRLEREDAASPWMIDTVAGSGIAGDIGDGGPPLDAQVHYPMGVALDSASKIYIADTGNNKIRMIAPRPATDEADLEAGAEPEGGGAVPGGPVCTVDGRCDAAAGETFATCPADCGVAGGGGGAPGAGGTGATGAGAGALPPGSTLGPGGTVGAPDDWTVGEIELGGGPPRDDRSGGGSGASGSKKGGGCSLVIY